MCAARAARDAATSDGGQTYVYASRRTRLWRFSAFACFAEPAPIQYEAYESISLKQRAACDDIPTAASKFFGDAAQLVDHAIKLGKTAEPVLYSTADADDLVALKRVAVSKSRGPRARGRRRRSTAQIRAGPGGSRGFSGGEGAIVG